MRSKQLVNCIMHHYKQYSPLLSSLTDYWCSGGGGFGYENSQPSTNGVEESTGQASKAGNKGKARQGEVIATAQLQGSLHKYRMLQESA